MANRHFYKILTSKDIIRLPIDVTSFHQQVYVKLWHCVAFHFVLAGEGNLLIL